MNIWHFKFVRQVRSLARAAGLISLVRRLLPTVQYEDAFHRAMKSAIRLGDNVWDVGANVGFYTIQFAGWTGAEGKVWAFEPLPAALKQLQTAIANVDITSAQIHIVPVALSDKPGRSKFEFGGETEAVTTVARISEKEIVAEASNLVMDIEVASADSILGNKVALPPNVIKIDVEGFEEEVLLGGTRTFENLACRHIFIEVHFGRLDERNKGEAPTRIVRVLKSWGYSVRWLDASHLHAFRPDFNLISA